MKSCGISILIATLAAGAAGLAAPAFAGDAGETEGIRRLLVETFDKPEARMVVEPVVIEEDAAIAGWSQNELGGRALLRRKDGKWEIRLCAGDALKRSADLERVGVAKAQAEALAAKLSAAERSLAPSRLEQFSRFDGIVAPDGPGGHSHADPHHDPKP